MKHTPLPLLLLTLVLSSLLNAAQWTVDTVSDNPADGLTLREAITDAAPSDSVIFSVSGTITLSSEIAIAKALTIDGAGQNITISGGDAQRIFHTSGSSNTITLRNLALTNGYASSTNDDALGGAVYNADAALTLEYCTVKDSVAEVTAADGNTDNAMGGGIASEGGSLTLRHCSIQSNTAQTTGGTASRLQAYGGAIYIGSGSSIIENTTVAGNTATGGTSDSDGGGLHINTNGTVTITNSTISGNACNDMGGGIFVDNATVNIYNTTITNNIADSGDAGGIQVETPSNVNLYSCIVLGAATGYEIESRVDGALTMDYCLYNVNNVNLGADIPAVIETTCVSADDAQLGVLSNNGGYGSTHRPLPTSPAVNAGANPLSLATDQNGNTRVQGAQADIGSVEINPNAPLLTYSTISFSESTDNDGTISNSLTVTLTNDTFTANPATAISSPNVPAGLSLSVTRDSDTQVTLSLSGNASAHAASDALSDLQITFANGAFSSGNASEVINADRSDISVDFFDPLLVLSDTDSGAGSLRDTIAAAAPDSVIFFDPAVTTITLTSGEIALSKNLVINGQGLVTISGNNASRIFNIAQGTITLKGLTLSDGFVQGTDENAQGGGIYSGGSLTLSDCVLQINELYTQNDTTTINRRSEGGALYHNGSYLKIEDCTFTQNIASGQDTVDGDGSGYGGALYIGGSGEALILNTTFDNNTATSDAPTKGDGAAIYINDAVTLDIVQCTFTQNMAGSNGAVCATGGTTRIFNSTIAGNTSSYHGDAGGITTTGYAEVAVYSSIVLEHSGCYDIEHRSSVPMTLDQCLYNSANITTSAGEIITINPNCIDTTTSAADALADNGGSTQTMALQTASLAIDAGSVTSAEAAGYDMSYDQRGANYTRTKGTAPDIGAFELQTDLPEINLTRLGATIADGATENVLGTAASTARQLTLTLENLGSADLSVTTPVSVSGQNNCAVVVDSQPANTLTPANTSNIVLTVTPSAAGAWSFDLSVTNDDSNETPYNVTLSGNAAASAAPAINVTDEATDSELSSGASLVKNGLPPTQASSLDFSILNAGSATLTLGAPAASNQSNCGVVVSAAPTSLDPEATDTLTLDITPTAAGDWSFDLSITTNDPTNNPYTLSLSGYAHATTNVSLQQGSESYTGGSDTWIELANPNTNYGTSHPLQTSSDDGVHAFVKWDVSALPANATILSATITLYEANNAAGQLLLHEAVRPWVDTEADYLNYASGLTWEENGAMSPADRDPEALAETSLPYATDAAITFDIPVAKLDYLQSWIGSPTNNKGLKIESQNASTVVQLHSAESTSTALRPTLTLAYTTDNLPEITVSRSGTEVLDGGTDVPPTVDTPSDTFTYVIENTGGADLLLKTAFTVSAESNCAVAVDTQPASTITAGNSSDLVVTVTPVDEGAWSFELSAETNDLSEPTFNWTVRSSYIKPEIALSNAGVAIADGGSDTVANTGAGYGKQVVYEIRNTGSLPLTLSTPISISAQNNCTVVVDTDPDTTVTSHSSTIVAMTVTPTTGGAWSFDVSVASNDGDENPYNWTVSGTASTSTSAPGPEIAVSCEGSNIANGGSLDFGNVEAVWEDDTVTRTFIIENLGEVNSLSLTDTPQVSISGANASDFSVVTQPAASVSPYGSTYFQITFNPSAKGTRTATVTFNNNDADEGTYTFTLTGQGTERALRILWAGNSFMAGGSSAPQHWAYFHEIVIITGHPEPDKDDHNGPGADATDHLYGRDPATQGASVGSTYMDPIYYQESGLDKGVIYESDVVSGGKQWDFLIMNTRSNANSNMLLPEDPRQRDGSEYPVPDQQNEDAMVDAFVAIYGYFQQHSPDGKLLCYTSWPYPSTWSVSAGDPYADKDAFAWDLTYTYERTCREVNRSYGEGVALVDRKPESYRLLSFDESQSGLYIWTDALNIDKHASSRGEILGGMNVFVQVFNEPVPLYAEYPTEIQSLLDEINADPEANESPLDSTDWDNLANTANQTFALNCPAIEFDTLDVDINEGGTATFHVRLSSAPADTVNVTVANRAANVNNSVDQTPTSNISVTTGASLTFTTGDWNQWQEVTLTAAEDDTDTIDGAALIAATADDDSCSMGRLIAFEADNDPMDAWLNAKGLSGADADFLADPDGDGLNNLIEYALNIDPANAGAANRPVAIHSGGNQLTLQFRRNKQASDLTYQVQSSIDLIHWQDVTSQYLEDIDADTETFEATIDAAADKAFLRLLINR